MTSIAFLGAAGAVTGSRFLLEHDGWRVLVDCGLFQGPKALRLRNWAAFPLSPGSIDAVVLTHAHLDHVGYLPRLVRDGYRGPVFCTPGTADLCSLVLPDSARIQQEDASYANHARFSKHAPALPLYTEADAGRALSLVRSVPYRTVCPLTRAITLDMRPAGHLLGSAFALVTLGGHTTIVFGGDLGRYDRPVLNDPGDLPDADVLLLESTYGDRDHAVDDHGETLAAIVRETIGSGGKLLIPSFAIGRVEDVLYWLGRLERERRIPVVPVYLDSPMATAALRQYQRGRHELDAQFCNDAGLWSFPSRFQAIASVQQSKELTASSTPAIVIASSGMATGGRVLHHLKRMLPRSRDTVLFAGYQAAGTRGRELVEGATEIKMHGELVAVGARIAQLESLSAHADRRDIVRWLRTAPAPPRTIWLVHGEPPAAAALQQRLRTELGLVVHIAGDGAHVELAPGCI